MISRTLASLLWALSLANHCLAFLRTVPDVGPFSYGYPKYAGVQNISRAIPYSGGGVKSYWAAYFYEGDNGHSYSGIWINANVNSTTILTSLSITDITGNTAYGESFYTPGQLSTTKLEAKADGILDIFATSEDQWDEISAISYSKVFPFNLTLKTRGPNLYQGGTGAYIWGSDIAYAFDNPEAYTTGSFTTPQGEHVNIVPEKSITWFDVQWGPGYAGYGWYSFVMLLDNGVKIATQTAKPLPDGSFNSIATFSYPDGHQEVYGIDPVTIASNPWVSNWTNITYYYDYEITVPLKGTFWLHLPVAGGEVTHRDDPTPDNSISDSFAYVKAFVDGEYINGIGIAERKVYKVTDL